MKTTLLYFSLFILFTCLVLSLINSEPERKSLGQNIAYCLPQTPTEQFAGFGGDLSFVNKHENPLPFEDFQMKGNMISFPVEDKKDANAYFIKSEKPSDDYLIVVHEWWGLNNYVKSESERLAKELGNINVLALDLYDGKVAETRENARAYMQSVTNDRAFAIIDGAANYIGENRNVFTIGWCFGGGWSLQTAIQLDDKVKGVVMFYGMPEEDLDRLAKLKADVLGVFAANEKWINPEVVAKFENNMANMKPNLTVKSYTAEHGFANPSNPRFDKKATEDAYKHVFAFIREKR